MNHHNNHLFSMGQILATRGILAVFDVSTLLALLMRHATGDFGDLDRSDQQSNLIAIVNGGRILSAYHIDNTKVYVITEYDRSVTTVLLVEEY